MPAWRGGAPFEERRRADELGSADFPMSEDMLNGKRPLVTMDKSADTNDWVTELTFENAIRPC